MIFLLTSITVTLTPFSIAAITSCMLWAMFAFWAMFNGDNKGYFGGGLETMLGFIACLILTLILWLGTFAYMYFS